jgi:ferric-dicitrate binding protein FerR (iron transport regulator)
MRREEFTDLLQRYLNNNCSEAERKLVDYWYSLLEADANHPSPAVNFDEVEARLWQRIKPVPDAPVYGKMEPASGRRRPPRWVGFAASFLLLGTIGWLAYPLWQQKDGPPEAVQAPETRNWTERVNTTAQPLNISLTDGSQITVEPGSRLRYPGAFTGDKREVHLEGEAFFRVARRTTQPFYVYAGRVVTKVLGTSFHVRTQEKTQQVQVEVVTGRVSVYEKKPGPGPAADTKGVVLNPNHKATYYPENQLFTTGLVDAPVLVDSAGSKGTVRRFVYDDTPVAGVIAELEAAYGVDITLENEQVSNCPITADVRKHSLYTQLDIICAALQATYSVRGTTILVSGKGCQ